MNASRPPVARFKQVKHLGYDDLHVTQGIREEGLRGGGNRGGRGLDMTDARYISAPLPEETPRFRYLDGIDVKLSLTHAEGRCICPRDTLPDNETRRTRARVLSEWRIQSCPARDVRMLDLARNTQMLAVLHEGRCKFPRPLQNCVFT